MTLLLLLAACEPSGLVVDDSASASDDTATPGTTVTSDDVHDLSWRLHDDIESIVYVTWTQDVAGTATVEYSFDADTWLTSPAFSAEAGTHEQILVGIPYDTTVTWQVNVDGVAVEGEALVTGTIDSDVPVAELTVSEPERWLATGSYLLTSINENDGGWTGGNYWTIILDRQGRVVWAQDAPGNHWTLFAQVAVSGDHFLWDEATYWSEWGQGDGEDSTVHRAWLDEEIEEISTPGLHHAFVQLPDDTLVWGSRDHGGEEALVEKAPDQIDETVIWTCQDDWPGSGRCESNGLFYVEETDTYLYSFYTNNSLVEVDRATGESLWWAGEVGGGYRVDPDDARFSWQHGISYTEAGTLLLSSEHYDEGWSTWLMEYEVDHENETLTYVWGDGAGVHAETNGQAWRLDNGGTLHIVGSAGVIREVDADGDDVWRLEYDSDYLLGQGEFIEDLYSLVKPRE